MILIWDNRKHKYLKDIQHPLLGGPYKAVVTTMPKRAYKFKNKDLNRLIHFEKLLNYRRGDLEYTEVK